MLEQKIRTLCKPFLDDEDAYIVAIDITNSGEWKKIEVFVDTDKGVVLDECARISRRLGHIMEEQDVVGSKYRLEVSSPGLSRPITHDRQMIRAIGKKLDITFTNDSNNTVTEALELTGVEDSFYTFSGSTEQIEKNKIKEIKFHLAW